MTPQPDPVLNDVVLTDVDIETIRRLVLNELRLVQNKMVNRMSQHPKVQNTQWWDDRNRQKQKLEAVLDAIAFVPEDTGTAQRG